MLTFDHSLYIAWGRLAEAEFFLTSLFLELIEVNEVPIGSRHIILYLLRCAELTSR
jgi:hypothetical protein